MIDLRHQRWMFNAAYYLGLLALVTLPWRAPDWMAWLLPIAVLYFIGSIAISVGYHRLFTHRAFKTSKAWHAILAYTGVAYLYGSPLQWAIGHSTHHAHADTDRDPHPLRHTALLTKAYREVPVDIWRARKLMRSPMQVFIDRYYVGIFLAIAASIALISLDFFLYAYVPAIGLAHFAGSLHNTISHWNNKPRDLAFMEWIVPTSGEWLHGIHHEKPGRWDFRTRWWHVDLGAAFIRVIKTS